LRDEWADEFFVEAEEALDALAGAPTPPIMVLCELFWSRQPRAFTPSHNLPMNGELLV
jgi:hypothetical protein